MNTMQQTHTVAYMTAYVAACDGKPNRNPWTKHTTRWHDYERGYRDGQRRAQQRAKWTGK